MKKTISIIALLILTGCDYQTTSEQNEALIRMGAAGVGAANRGDSYIEAKWKKQSMLSTLAIISTNNKTEYL